MPRLAPAPPASAPVHHSVPCPCISPVQEATKMTRLPVTLQILRPFTLSVCVCEFFEEGLAVLLV